MMEFWQLLAACALGALLTYGYFTLRGRENHEVKGLQAKLSRKNDELERYKRDVQEHFVGTAQAIDDLTHSYRRVFDQLEHDAHQLLGERPFQDALAERAERERQTPELPVIDERLDRSESASEAQSSTPRGTPQLG